MTDLTKALLLLDSGSPREAIEILNRLDKSSPDNPEVLFVRGKAFWRLGLRDRATADYAAAARLNPSGPAARALENARDIASFFNPDIFNP